MCVCGFFATRLGFCVLLAGGGDEGEGGNHLSLAFLGMYCLTFVCWYVLTLIVLRAVLGCALLPFFSCLCVLFDIFYEPNISIMFHVYVISDGFSCRDRGCMEFFICNVVLFCASCFALSACHFFYVCLLSSYWFFTFPREPSRAGMLEWPVSPLYVLCCFRFQR